MLQSCDENGIKANQRRLLLANICGISVQEIAQLVRGAIKSPRSESIAKVAEYFDEDLYWLITGTESVTKGSITGS